MMSYFCQSVFMASSLFLCGSPGGNWMKHCWLTDFLPVRKVPGAGLLGRTAIYQWQAMIEGHMPGNLDKIT